MLGKRTKHSHSGSEGAHLMLPASHCHMRASGRCSVCCLLQGTFTVTLGMEHLVTATSHGSRVLTDSFHQSAPTPFSGVDTGSRHLHAEREPTNFGERCL